MDCGEDAEENLAYDACVWCRAWLLTTVFDYYVMTFCMCGVILATEERLGVGVGWSLGCCLAGAPTACLWVGLQLWRREGGLSLQGRGGAKLFGGSE